MACSHTMDNFEIIDFFGQKCLSVENAVLKLLVTQSVGPRILSLSLCGGENLMAELPDFVVDCPGSGKFHAYGGHRLWHAPEEPGRTYLPDDDPVEITPLDNGYLLTQGVELKTGLQKSMEICLQGDEPRVIITHRLSNHGLFPVTCAPWAITQLKVGGVAILPQSCVDTNLLPNRSLIFWPYTDPSGSNVTWGKNYILVRVNVDVPFKVGFPNPRGWLAYWLNGTLFVKRAKFDVQSAYFDFGSSSECYCNDQFIELETLAPIGVIDPGMHATHVETWELYGGLDRPQNERDVQCLVEKLGLE